MNLPTGLPARFSERGPEPLPILPVLEDRLAPIPAVQPVIDRARTLDSALARPLSNALRDHAERGQYSLTIHSGGKTLFTA